MRMNDFDIKSKVNDSVTHGLVRVIGGRLYHVFPAGQKQNRRVTICGFWPSYPVPDFVVERAMSEGRLDLYPLCKGCKEAFLKLDTR
jgi:hypothetical protein